MTHWSKVVTNLLEADTKDLRQLAKIAGHDPATFYRHTSVAELNLSTQDLTGMEFLDYLPKIPNIDQKERLRAEKRAEGILSQNKVVPTKIGRKVRELDLSETEFMNIALLKPMVYLQKLKITDVETEEDKKLINWESIKNNKYLETLEASWSNINTLEPLRGHFRLQALYVNNTQIKDIEPISNLLDLQFLNITDTFVSDLTPISNLNRLEKLFFHTTKITDITTLSKLKNLKGLYFVESEITNITPISQLEQLEDLYVLNNKFESGFDSIANLRNLKRLNLQGTNISDLEPLASMKHLRELYINNTNITDITPLENIASLKYVDAIQTSIQDWSPVNHVDIVEGRPNNWIKTGS